MKSLFIAAATLALAAATLDLEAPAFDMVRALPRCFKAFVMETVHSRAAYAAVRCRT